MMEFQSIVPAKWNHFGHLLKDGFTLRWSILSLAGLEGVEARLPWDWDSFVLGIAGYA